jgi:hypothetical protein
MCIIEIVRCRLEDKYMDCDKVQRKGSILRCLYSFIYENSIDIELYIVGGYSSSHKNGTDKRETLV